MMRKMIAILTVLVLVAAMAACGGGKETTLTGMVVAVEGTVISLMETGGDRGNGGFGGSRPEGSSNGNGFGGFGGFGGNFGNFNPEDFDGTMPTGEGFPQWGNGEFPEGMTMPEGMTRPEMGEMPEGMTLPEGMTMPENGQMPSFGGFGGNFEDFAGDMETTDVDISGARISVEVEGGKASGSMEDVTAGAMVTITTDGKGKVISVLVSQSRFGGRGQR